MQNPSNEATGETHNHSAERKRKLPSRQPSSNNLTDGTPSAKQQTISELFSVSQQKPSARDGSGVPLSPTSKRIRLDPAANDLPPATPSDRTSTPVMSPDNMYASFPSKRTSNGNVIDLTSSPSSTPPPRKNGMMRNPNFNPHLGAKKLTVKNFRTQPKTDPKQYLNQTWAKLDEALDIVFANEKLTFSLEELYRGVENLCRQGHAAELSQRLRKKCKDYVEKGLKEPLLVKVSERNVDVLRAVLATWGTWNKQLKTIHWIFCYMDRSYLLQQHRSLQDMAIELFRDIIFYDPHLQTKIIGGACDLVATYRQGDNVEESTFRDAIKMFHELSTYSGTFEPRMLELSQSYIIDWTEQTSVEMSLPGYVKASVELMDREMARCEMFGLDATTRRDLLTLLEDHIISRKEDRLINQDEVADLLDNNAVDSLEQLYSLLERRRLGVKLRPAFEKWIDDTGTAIVFDEKEQDQMVIKLLTLKKQLDTIWRVSFHRNQELGHGLRESFETFINKQKKTSTTWNTDNSKPGEMIAKYVDMLLRGGAKAIPVALSSTTTKHAAPDEDDAEDVMFDEDTEVNSQLDQVLDLFRFVHGKAVFEAFYKKDLARRLLMGRSASADAERSMLARLKTECGSGFTQNLEQMFKDVELAREVMANYKALFSDRERDNRDEKPALDLSVNVLSASAWPSYPDVPVIVPPDIKNAIDKFEEHYKSKHSGRKLDWKHALAHCQLKARFPRGQKELVVSSFQAIVLLLFNGVGEGEKLTYEYIKASTGLPPAELNRTLQSLACAKLRPLTKHPKGRDIDPTDSFSLNVSFWHEKYRVKINQVQLKETKEENKETHERVAADRNFETQAAIVRIMKSRKLIGHSELIAEVITATKARGVLSVADIKKNIDRLIEKDYMEREDGNQYSYVA